MVKSNMTKRLCRVMLTLVITFLVGLYVAKFFFPKEFAMVIQNENIVKFGHFVDTHLWLHIILGVVTSFITYWLYLCAIKHKWTLNWKEILIVLGICIVTQVFFYFIDSSIGTQISLISMILLPLLFKGNLRDMCIAFSVHSTSQVLSIKIRGLANYLVNVNYASILLMGLECYFWLLLFYIYYNQKEI